MTARDRRALLAGAGIVAAAVLVLRFIPAAIRYHAALRARVQERVVMLERGREVLAQAGAIQDSFERAARALVSLAPMVVAGATASEAAANLTSELSMVADRSGLRVVQLNAVPDSGRGTFVPVRLRGQLEGDIASLTHFLAVAERSPVLLTVPSLDISAADPLERAPGPERLRVDLVISGWRLNRSSP